MGLDTTTEAQVRDLCSRADYGGAASRALEGYGQEILSFLIARSDATLADDAFALFGETMWQALPQFAWRSSLRTWAYQLARRALSRQRRAPHNRGERRLALSDAGLARVVDRVRTETQTFRRTETKTRVRGLREQLSADDQALLMLHVDRDMSFSEVAQVLFFDEGVPNEDELARANARLRKRFKLVKERLRRLMVAEGLL